MVWALDLGTTNTGVARWNEAEGRPEIVELPSLCRKPGGSDHLQAPRLVPSATHVLPAPSTLARLPLLSRRMLWGRHAHIGRQALERNETHPGPAFVPSFKPYLSEQALRPIAQAGGRAISARGVAWMFCRELLREVRDVTGERMREVTLTTPVDAYEAYRAELALIFRGLGVKRVRFLDEPVAAALGYGLTLQSERTVLVADFGGGTFHLVAVRMSAHGVEAGQCNVLAKEARAVGGNLVDRWLLDHFLERLQYPLRDEGGASDEHALWYRLLLAEACRVKEALFFEPRVSFGLLPPEELREFEARLSGGVTNIEVTRDELVSVLEQRGLYALFDECLAGIETQLAAQQLGLAELDEVLVVGGSNLLPGVYPKLEARFGRDRVRAWQPFEAVAHGAAAFAADRYRQSDFVVHDYAFRTFDANSHKPEYTVVVPRGTRFPTAPDLWKRQLVPTCSLGEPETHFKLVICELGQSESQARRFQWDADGRLHATGGAAVPGSAASTAEPRLVVPLNESSPTLGKLDPPHRPSDKRARLEIAFGVNAERWLVATVRDLLTDRRLMHEQPVVRLL